MDPYCGFRVAVFLTPYPSKNLQVAPKRESRLEQCFGIRAGTHRILGLWIGFRAYNLRFRETCGSKSCKKNSHNSTWPFHVPCSFPCNNPLLEFYVPIYPHTTPRYALNPNPCHVLE